MANNVGDKCPRCKEGLIVRTTTGVACDQCSWELDIDEVVEQRDKSKTQIGDFVFKPRTFKITIDDPEEGEQFLRGLIVARTNNSSEFFPQLIDAVNAILEPWRAKKLHEQLAARDFGS